MSCIARGALGLVEQWLPEMTLKRLENILYYADNNPTSQTSSRFHHTCGLESQESAVWSRQNAKEQDYE